MNYPQSLQSIRTGRSSLEKWLQKNYPEFKLFLDEKYPGTSYQCGLYMFYNGIDSIPLCDCGKPVKFYGNQYGFARWCSPTCAQTSNEILNKHKSTCLERYGVEYSLQNDKIRMKAIQTKEEKYGDRNYNNKQKYKSTCLERYGVDNPQKSQIIRKKVENTCLERYGETSFLKTQTVKKINDEKFILNNPYFISKVGDVYKFKCSNPNCNKCSEKEYETNYDLHYQRINVYNIEPCPKCIGIGESVQNNKNTEIERFIQTILDEYNISYITNSRPFDNKELDIYIPDMGIAVECNGCYWHNSSQKSKSYHYDKYKTCLDNNVQLITVWDDQIKSKPDIVRGIILSKLNIYTNRVYARKCIIKIISNKIAGEFLTSNHLQGKVNGGINLGLYYNNELISVMTFGKARKCIGGKDEWELYRYCNKIGWQIIGGAGKLFKYFLNNYNPSSIISFSSNDISIGLLYKKLGFEFISNSLSYWYVKNHIRYHRYKFRKSELVRMGYDPNKTEEQIMLEAGYLKIYDTGQSKWVFKNH